jgi:hypothetical protein
MNKFAAALHGATHQVPGVPAHNEKQPLQQLKAHQSDGHPHPRSPERHHQLPERHAGARTNCVAELDR